MTKGEFIKAIAEKTGATIKQTETIVNAAFKELAAVLEKGDKLTIPGFGTFCVVETKERKARNPRTGEEMTIPARKAVRFRPSSALKEKVQ